MGNSLFVVKMRQMTDNYFFQMPNCYNKLFNKRLFCDYDYY